MITEGINYLIYPVIFRNRSNVSYQTFPAGRTMYRNPWEMEYDRLIQPNAININFVANEDIDLYDYNITDIDTLKGQYLFFQYACTMPVFNKDNLENVLTDLISYGVLCVLDNYYTKGFAAVSLFNSLMTSFEEKNKTEIISIKKISSLRGCEL
jgi:hypothetical protein